MQTERGCLLIMLMGLTMIGLVAISCTDTKSQSYDDKQNSKDIFEKIQIYENDGFIATSDTFKMGNPEPECARGQELQSDPNESLYYYSGGKKVYLEKVAGEFFVKVPKGSELVAGCNLEEVPAAALSRLPFLPTSSPYRICKASVAEDPSNQTAAASSQSQKILWKTPVVVRKGQDQRVHLLNRIIVGFSKTATDSEIMELLSNYPVRDAKTASRRKGRCVLEVHAQHVDNICEIANELYENHLTVYVHPDFLDPIKKAVHGR